MNDLNSIRALATSFEEVEESPHFEKVSFRVRKKIFLTVDETKKLITLKLSLVDQSVFTDLGATKIYPVPNKWGQQGWTFAAYEDLEAELLKDLIQCAYCEVAPQSIAKKYQP